MKRLLFIYNPHAGKGLLKPKLSDIVDIFVKEDYEVVIYPTQGNKDAYRKVLSYEAGAYDLIVCSGGDGTLDEVVTGMMNREKKDPIGYIPTGTTNDFAHSLGIPKGLLDAAKNAVTGKEFACDAGDFNGDTFVYVAAFGLFTATSYETDQNLKNMLGHLAYVLSGAKELLNIPSYNIRAEHDGEVIEGEFMYGMVTNSRSVGGFRNMISQDMEFDDGLFEVTLIRTPKNPLELNEIIAALLVENFDTQYMHRFMTSEISFASQEVVPWTLDGEYGGDHKEVTVKNRQKQITLMIPKEQ